MNKRAPITFASIVGKKEAVNIAGGGGGSGGDDSLSDFMFKPDYTPPTILPHYSPDFATWILYNFHKIKDCHEIVVKNTDDPDYYSSFNFFDKLAHFIYEKCDKTVSIYDEINESDDLFEYIIKRDIDTYKE